jgi:hypothetical protein
MLHPLAGALLKNVAVGGITALAGYGVRRLLSGGYSSKPIDQLPDDYFDDDEEGQEEEE